MSTATTPDRVRDAHAFRVAAVVLAVVLPVATLVGYYLDGVDGALGAALGVLLVTISFTISAYAVLRSARVSPQTMFFTAVTTYTLKFAILGGVLFAVRDSDAFNGRIFGVTAVATTLLWMVLQVRIFSAAKILYVDPANHG